LLTPYDIPAAIFIDKLANYLKDNFDAITPPTWASFVKTSPHTQRQPEKADWWYIRCASLLRKIYITGPIGVEKLRAEYGGRKNYGSKPAHATKSGRAIIRRNLQQLELVGLIEKFQNRGRKITKNGRKLLEELATTLEREAIKEVPELKKYQRSG
jgi:small subunit ribosomal protein S19e